MVPSHPFLLVVFVGLSVGRQAVGEGSSADGPATRCRVVQGSLRYAPATLGCGAEPFQGFRNHIGHICSATPRGLYIEAQGSNPYGIATLGDTRMAHAGHTRRAHHGGTTTAHPDGPAPSSRHDRRPTASHITSRRGLPPAPPLASLDLSPTQAAAYAQVLKLRLDSARTLLAPELRAAQPDPRAVLVQDCADFADVVLRQDAARYPAALAAMDAHLATVEAAAKRRPGPWPTFAAAEIQLHRAIAQVCFDDEISGAWALRQAMLRLDAGARQYPDFLPLRKSLGLCQFLVGVVPDSYQWFLRALGLRGSTTTGLANLSRAADGPNPFQTEARIFRALIREGYYHQETDIAALTAQLVRREPDNLLFCYLRLAALKRQKQPDAALRAFRARPTGRGYVPLLYLHHMVADLLLYRGDYVGSAQHNEYFLRRYPGLHYRKDACLKLYLAAWLRHDEAVAARWLAEIDKQGAARIEEDRAAQRFFDERPPLNERLYRARLAADGGYWRLAQRLLNGFQFAPQTPRVQRAEWCYRQARVYHGQQKLDSARYFYQRTIAVAEDEPHYFAPNAALQLGYLARAANDEKNARQYFEKALAYPRHEYKRSIDSQAKAALAR